MAKSFNVKTIFTAKDKTSLVMNDISKRASKTVRQVGMIGGAAAVAFGTIGTMLVKEASKIEDVTAAFTPLMGGVKKAEELVSELNKTAATTPFQLENIADSATQLLPAMNRDISKTIKTFRMLGDTAGGNTEKLKRISSVYSRVLLKNKLETGDLNILTERGIPIYKELSESMGVSVEEMAKMASQGKITGKDLTKAFEKMTSKGGVFFKGMEIASKTLTGKISTLKDNIALTAADLGSNLLPVIKKVTTKLIDVTQEIRTFVANNKELIKTKLDKFIKKTTMFFVKFFKVAKMTAKIFVKFAPLIKVAAVAFVAYKLALFGAIAAQKTYIAFLAVAKFMKFVRVLIMMARIKGIATAAQWALNAAMTANPVGVIIVGIGALIAAIILLIVYYKQVIKFTNEWWDAFAGLMSVLNPLMAPLLFTISALKSIAENWDNIKEAFKTKGFIGGIIEIGKAIVSGVLAPIEAVLKLLAKIPGIKKIANAGLDFVSGLDQKIGSGNQAKTDSASASAITRASNNTTTSNSTLDINVNDKNGNADIQKKGKMQGINFSLNQGVQ